MVFQLSRLARCRSARVLFSVALMAWLSPGVRRLSGQVSNYQLFQQLQNQQQPQQPQSPLNVPEYCADPTNMSRPECANAAQNQGREDDHPGSYQRNARRYPVTPPSSGVAEETNPDNPRTGSPSYRAVEPLTEFQRYVHGSIGRVLPNYGTWLFEHVPTTFAPVDRIPVTPEYAIGPGDEVDIRVWGQISFSQRLMVDRGGEIFIPQVGPVNVAGLKFSQLRAAIQSAIARVYQNFDLNVNMGQLRSIQIFVVGQARRPGAYTISSLSTLVNALFASGGPSSLGSMRDIQLKRGGQIVTHFDLYDLLLRGDKSKDAAVQPGDVLFFPNAGPRVAVAGSVEYPAIYEMREDAVLREALEYAGGLSSVASGKEALLERINGRAQPAADRIPLTSSGLASPLRNGDIIDVAAIVPRFQNTVTLRGNVAEPGRYPWHAGMKVSDLIPDRQALLTRDYWRETNRLVSETEERVQTTREQATRNTIDLQNLEQTGNPSSPGLPPGTNSSATDRLNGAAPLPSTYREENRNTAADTSLGAAQAGGNVPPLREFNWRHDVQFAAPDIDWDYAVIERLDLKTLSPRLIAFNLGKAVGDKDPTADLPLEAGDIVNIFSSADISVPRAQQTKFVRLEGEVKMAGIYSVQPGETLRQVVARAGGFSSDAYLYGTQFTRESARKEQQKRYNEYLDELEKEVDQGAANLTGTVLSAERANVAQTAIGSQRGMIDRLRQTPVSGRIVLDMKPDSAGVLAIPDLPLENGDRLYVPNRPSTVSVVGTVYNQSSFLYGSDLRLGDYLSEAGGATRFADKARTFVIRADGSVIARNGRSGLFTRGFESLALYPGDTLVVPANVSKTTFLRGLIDWSQVIGNFGIGAAAVNVLR